MRYRIKEYSDLRQRVLSMDVDDLLRCVICPDYHPNDEISSYKTSAFMLHPTTRDIAIKKLSEFNGADQSDRSLVTADMEFGAGGALVGGTRFPSMRAAAEAGDEDLAYEMGVTAASEAMAAGYSWTFGPCIDILGNHRNPVVSIRTAGEDADTVLRYGSAYMRGLQDTGMIATLKHFPGDGYAPHDQHVTVVYNPLSREKWDDSFGKVYQTLIDQGAKSIMAGHIGLPSYDEIDPETGLYPPATLSKNLLAGLLRKKLGFEGIIISDAIEMSGFCGYMNFYRACARFLEAGGDCLLFFHESEESFSAMKKLIDKGELTVETLRDRAYRMLCFAREYYEQAKIKSRQPDPIRADACVKKMTYGAVKTVRDRGGLLPVRGDRGLRVAHVILHNAGTPELIAANEMTQKLKERFDVADELRDPGPRKLQAIATSGEYDLIVCSIVCQASYGLNCVKLSGTVTRNLMRGWMRYDTPVAFVCYYDPYFCEDFEALADTVINTYGYSKYTNDAVLEQLFY